jgi:hypothetical protein
MPFCHHLDLEEIKLTYFAALVFHGKNNFYSIFMIFFGLVQGQTTVKKNVSARRTTPCPFSPPIALYEAGVR